MLPKILSQDSNYDEWCEQEILNAYREAAECDDFLFGDYNFKGKLPHSWPKSIEDYKGKYGPNFWDNSIEPLFKIGYGLTY